MRFLLDTHLLLWFAEGSDRMPRDVRGLIEDAESEPLFSTASIWEVAIKHSLKRPGFRTDARLLHRHLIENDFVELAISSEHAADVQDLPRLHGDPFDRLFIAQARREGVILLTADHQLAAYESPVRLI